jgi:hypothetical protein
VAVKQARLSRPSPSKSFQKARIKAPFDVIIVPGIPYADHDWASNVMKDRAVWPFYPYKKGIAHNVSFSGNAIAVATDPFQSTTFKTYALDIGIPVAFILIVNDSLRYVKIEFSLKTDPSAAYVKHFVTLPQRVNILRRILEAPGFEIRNDEKE